MGNRYLTRGTEALSERNYVNVPERDRISIKRKVKRRNNAGEGGYADSSFAPSINLAGFFILTAVAIFLLYSCIQYLKIYDEIGKTEVKTKGIIYDTDELRVENNNKEVKIYSGIDLEKIRETAIEELGMVYPSENTIVTYNTTNNSYVRQYGDLKGNEEKSIFERVLQMIAAR